MQVFVVSIPERFDRFPEWRPGFHLAVSTVGNDPFLVIGTLVALPLHEIGTPIEPTEGYEFCAENWLNHKHRHRVPLFEEWIDLQPTQHMLRPVMTIDDQNLLSSVTALIDGGPETSRSRSARAMHLMLATIDILVSRT